MVKEFELLAEIYRHNDAFSEPDGSGRRKGIPAGLADAAIALQDWHPRSVPIPPGDDMGMVRISGAGNASGNGDGDNQRGASSANVLIAVDQIVGNSHVNLDQDPIELIGRKAITRNISDIAAMAAVPVASVAACVLPRGFSRERAEDLFHAMRAVAAHYGCPLIGGDISMSRDSPLIISVTVLAEPGPYGVKRRGDAKPGDDVYVSGRLGGAWRRPHPTVKPSPSAKPDLSDQDMPANAPRSTVTSSGRSTPGPTVAERAVAGAAGWPGRSWHLTFEPRVALALELARTLPVHAMIDLSDGLGRDLDHISECSRLHAEVDAQRLPITAGCDWQQAVGDGEDYELCFTVPGGTEVPPECCGVRLTRIGRMVDPAVSPDSATSGEAAGPRTVVVHDGRRYDAGAFGWEHSDG